MNGYTGARTEPYWSRAWTIGGAAVGAGALAMLLDLLVATGASYLWLGLLDLALGVGVAASVVAVTGGHRPLVVRAGVGLLALFILVFAANLILVSVPGWA